MGEATPKLCGHRTKTTDGPCENRGVPGTVACAAGHPVAARPPSPPSSPSPSAPPPVCMEDLLCGDPPFGAMSSRDIEAQARFFDVDPGNPCAATLSWNICGLHEYGGSASSDDLEAEVLLPGIAAPTQVEVLARA